MTGTAPSTPPSRRGWLQWLLGTSLGAVVVAALYPVVRFVLPPKESESTQDRVEATKLSSLPPNSGIVFRFGAQPAIVIRTPSGDIRAFTAVCTHLGCTVQYRKDLVQIWCPCHNGHYNLKGVPVAGPPPRPLTPYKVAVENGAVWVSRS